MSQCNLYLRNDSVCVCVCVCVHVYVLWPDLIYQFGKRAGSVDSVCAVQAAETLGGRSGEGGPGEGLSDSSYPSLSKNQDDFGRHHWYYRNDMRVPGAGKLIWILITTAPVIPLSYSSKLFFMMTKGLQDRNTLLINVLLILLFGTVK